MIPVEQRNLPRTGKFVRVGRDNPFTDIGKVSLRNLQHVRMDIHIRKLLKHIRWIIKRTRKYTVNDQQYKNQQKITTIP